MTNEHDMPTGPLTSTDDPRLLAYLLGELDDTDVAHVESYIADTPGAKAELDELRAVLGLLETEMPGEGAAPKLHDGQRAQIAAAASAPTSTARGSSGVWLRAAASIVATLGLGWLAVELLDDGAGFLAPADTTVVKGEPMSMERIRALRDGDDEARLRARGYAEGEREFPTLDELEELGYIGSGSDDADSSTVHVEVSGPPPSRDAVTVVTEAVDEAATDAPFDSSGLNDAIGIGGGASSDPSFGSVTEAQTPQGDSVTGRGGGFGKLGRRARPRPASETSPEAPARAQWDDAPPVLNESVPTTSSAAPVATPGADARRLVDMGYITNEPPSVDDDRDTRRSASPRDTRAEGFAAVPENPFVSPADPQHALSTFGLDVDTASYAYMRRMLNEGKLPPPSSIRLEELINTFDYDDAWAQEALAEGDAPIALRVDGGWCPWAPEHRLVRLSMQAVEPDVGERPPANLVFLLDVSGSMKADDRLPLLKSAMRLLVSTLRADDRVAIVTYNDTAGVTLESTSCDRKDVILAALDGLRAGGSTNGEAGLRRAYDVASEHFVDGGVNRVILASDGDFNVGAQSRDELYGLITQQATSGVFLTVLGFGTGNLKDSNLELLADRGNGNYAYIDTLAEGEKVLVEEAGSTLQTVAKDVKIQVEFNPGQVAAYRLLGYENRVLAARDFNDDRKDAGDVGAGHTVTALYEVIPAGVEWEPQVDELKYQQRPAAPEPESLTVFVTNAEMLTAKLRYKQPDADTSELMVVPYVDRPVDVDPDERAAGAELGDDLRFASAVTAFGMLLRGSEHAGSADFDLVIDLAERSRGDDPRGYRAEFVRLAKMAGGLAGR